MARKKTTTDAGAVSPEKLAKFRELAESRVAKAIKAIEVIGNLSNRASYAWEQPLIDQMTQALTDAVTDTMDRFGENGSTKKGFSFND